MNKTTCGSCSHEILVGGSEREEKIKKQENENYQMKPGTDKYEEKHW